MVPSYIEVIGIAFLSLRWALCNLEFFSLGLVFHGKIIKYDPRIVLHCEMSEWLRLTYWSVVYLIRLEQARHP